MKNLKTLFVAAAAAVALSGVSHADALVVNSGTPAAPATLSASGTIVKYVQFTDPKDETRAVAVDLGAPTSTDVAKSSAPAVISFAANTHIQLTVVNGGDMATASKSGKADSLVTRFIVGVKGSDVKAGTTAVDTSKGFADLAPTLKDGSSTFTFGHGPGSGVRLNIEADRKGLDDLFGTYSTNATLTWADLD